MDRTLNRVLNRVLKQMLPVVVLLGAETALAGGWVSGGGELIRDGQNPWFIQNIREVRYCIKQDRQHFDLEPTLVRRRIDQALEYWKVEFARGRSFEDRVVKVATQMFVEVSCAEEHKLTFQLGTLTGEQMEKIGDPRRFVSLAIRTGYDPKTLSGEGFVYVAPDSGPLKPEGEGLVARPWTLAEGGLFYRVLVHELGHVFGLQHSGEAPRDTGAGIMSAMWPEVMLTDFEAEKRAANDVLPNFFKFDFRTTDVRNYCSESLPPSLISFFGLPSDAKCWRIRHENGRFDVYGGPDVDHLVKSGSIEITEVPKAERYKPAVNLWLTPEQEIYAPVAAPGEYVGGPMIEVTFAKGTYRSLDGSLSYPMLVNYPSHDSDWPAITAIWNGGFARLR